MGQTKLKGKGSPELSPFTEGLSDRQRAFVFEYVKHADAKKAAIAAGYKRSSAAVTGTKLLANKAVASAIGHHQNRHLKNLNLDTETILRELSYNALRDPLDLCDENGKIVVSDMRQIPERMRRCIDSIKVRKWLDREGNEHQEIELKLTSKLGAIELCMRHFGMLQPKQVEIKHSIDWDDLYSSPTNKVPDLIENRIIEVQPAVVDDAPMTPKSLRTLPKPIPGTATPTFDIEDVSEADGD